LRFGLCFDVSQFAENPVEDPMTWFLLIVFGGLCLALVAWGMRKPGRFCEYPFLAGATFGGFIMPMAVGMAMANTISPLLLDQALALCILCAAMCYLGYVAGETRFISRGWEFDENRLAIVAVALSVFGGFFYILLAGLPDELVATGASTGVAVVYYFFSSTLRYGFAIGVLLYAKRRSKLALAAVLFDSFFLFYMIVIRGRRNFAVEVLLILLCCAWFVGRKTLPRWAMAVLLIAGLFGVAGVGAYRAAMYQDQAYGGALRHEIPVGEILQIDFVDTFLTYMQEEAYEMKNLAYVIQVTDSFDWGLSYYNEFVYVYVPAQVVGAEFKESLRFDVPGELLAPGSPPATTEFGVGDSYQAFGWFGCFVFFLIAFAMRRMFDRADAGHTAAQIVYMLTVTVSMNSITHHTKYFLTPWLHLGVFLGPGLLWAHKARNSAVAEQVGN
jgi:hypothetical protein